MADIATLTGTLLDSQGKPANGRIYTRVTSEIPITEGLITRTQAEGVVVDGRFEALSGGPFYLPVTPEGVAVQIWVELREPGRGTTTTQKKTIARTVSVPDQNTVTWEELVDVVPVVPGGDYVVPPWVAEIKGDAETARDTAVEKATEASTAAATATTAKTDAETASTAAASARDDAVEAFNVIVTTPLKNDRDNGQAGMIAPSTTVYSESSNLMTSGRVYAARFVPTRQITARSIAFSVVTAATNNDPIEVGFISPSGEVIASSGAVTGRMNSTGVKSVPVPETVLESGQVYYAFALTVAAGNSGALRRCHVFASAFGTGLGVAESMGANSKTIPLASPVTGLAANDAGPILVVREFV